MWTSEVISWLAHEVHDSTVGTGAGVGTAPIWRDHPSFHSLQFSCLFLPEGTLESPPEAPGRMPSLLGAEPLRLGRGYCLIILEAG